LTSEIIFEPKREIEKFLFSQFQEFPLRLEGYNESFALKQDGKIVAACVFTGWKELWLNHNEIEMSIAVLPGHGLTLRSIRTAMWLAFVHFNCHRLVVGVHQDNHRSIKIIEKYGFVKEGTLRDRYGLNQDCLTYSMLRTECKVLEREFEKAKKALEKAA
jgi:RimJ/RimL family protein N-acetyltransferase